MAPKVAGELVGRDAELERASAFLESVPDGPAALLIEGDAGIGKTSIWLRCASEARERGFTVVAAHAAQAETTLGFTTLVDLFGDVTDGVLETLPPPQRRALEVALLRSDATQKRADHRAVSMAALGVVRNLAATGPLVLAVDDLQWVDAASARVVHFVLRRLDDEPVGLLATRRVERSEATTGLERTLPAPRIHRLQLGALDLKAIDSVLETFGTRLSRSTLRKVYSTSGGNPFFALELARALGRHDLPALPDSLQQLVRNRLEALGREAEQTLFVASALSHPTVEQVVHAVGGEATGLRGLERAAEAQVVDLEDGAITFTHPLLASAIYASRAPAERRSLHRTLAKVASDPEERGRHLALGTVGPNAEIAAVVERAADRARRRGAPDAAAELYEHAKRLTKVADGPDGYRRTIEIAEARLHAGDAHAARLAFAEASEGAPNGHARAYALTRLGEMLVIDWNANLSAALETYQRASRDAAGDPSLLAAVEVDLAWLWHFRDNQTRSRAHARRALELAEEVGDKARVAHALATVAVVEGRRGNDEAWTFLERASRLEEHVRDEPFAGRPQFVRALFLLGDGRFEEAREISSTAYRRALERGDESSVLTLLEQLTIIERRAGRWDEAEGYAREMYAAAEGGGFMPPYHSAPYALILALRGRTAEARALVEAHVAVADAAGIGPTFGGHRSVLGFIALSLGDAQACIRHLEPLSSLLTSEIEETGWFRFLADEAEARVAVGEVEQARALVERLAERRSVLFDRAWARAATERCRGLVFAASGEDGKAGEAFARALAEHDELPEPFELARTLLAQGRAERRFKRRRAAREALTSAHRIFSNLGAPLWVERAELELSRIGGRSPRAAGLTATEQQVAQLTATGLTNRQIAAELFISENTVETNLKRIYRELGVRSRTELAAKLLVPSQ